MPMKCIAQMPPPMLNAPALVHAHRPCHELAATIREDIESAANAAAIAIRTETATRDGS